LLDGASAVGNPVLPAMARRAKESNAAANSEDTSDPRAQVTDTFLLSVLQASDDAKQQCMALLDFLDQAQADAGAAHSSEAALELSKQKKLLYSHLARVRNMNRQGIMDVRQTKQKTAEARQEVDTLHLQLQNLYYEQRHLKSEIAACEDFEYVDKTRFSSAQLILSHNSNRCQNIATNTNAST
jgi:hypothetical protein